ncbi:hypothetical protein SAMN05216319_3622 [Duganella sp. CF402]|nr:hypothetical protein EV582_5483 [Duganella sp. BK701]SEM31006.1 hypothetical protein SAMN05216319_3622 [Duganella sp. CF402]
MKKQGKLVLKAAVAALAMLAFGQTVAQPMEVGVAVHFGHNRGNLALTQDFVAKSGFVSVRSDVSWGMSENASGVLGLRDGSLLLRNAMLQLPTVTRPVYIFAYGNALYDGGGQPSTPAGYAAYSRFTSTILPQLPNFNSSYVELWNEWNLGAGTKPAVRTGSVVDYSAMVKVAAPAVRKVAPGAKILVGALADDFPDWTFAKGMLSQGALDVADGLSVHIYNHCAGTKVGSDEAMGRLDALRGYMVAAGKGAKPIYVTEFGWPSNTAGTCGVPEMDGALYTVRFLLEASTRNWLGGIWLYELLEGGLDPADRESHFGAYRMTEIPNSRDAVLKATPILPEVTAAATKPIGCVVTSVAKLIGNRPVLTSSAGALRSALYDDGTRRMVALWNASTKPLVAPTGTLNVTGGKGGAINPLALCGVAGGSYVQKSATATGTSFGFTLKGGAPLLLEFPSSTAITGIEVRE